MTDLIIQNGTRARATRSIVAVAAFQVAASMMSLFLFQRGLRNEYFSDKYSVDPGTSLFLGILLGIFLVGIVTAVGLVRLKTWARMFTLFLATAPVCATAVGAALYKRQPGLDFTPAILDGLLILLLPVSMWWWILFTRKSVRAQFR